MAQHYLDHLFKPESIAVFGASEKPKTVGSIVFENLVTGPFKGKVYPMNPKYQELRGHTCYARIDDVREPVDLAVIATPAATVPELIHQCGQAGVRAAVVLSAGFGEVKGEGKRLEKAMLAEAQRFGMRILGPNCLGFIRPDMGINATFSKQTAEPGSLALVSQSGALCTAILDWAVAHQVGFSSVISMGDAADIDFGDVLDYLALDPETRSILLYVEGVRNARSFLSGLRVAARMKPVVVVKAGRHQEGSRAAMSHTGALVGGDDVFDAALKRAGVVRAMTVEQLFAAAQMLDTRHRVRGNRVAIVTNAGGPGVLATDRAVDLSVAIAKPDDETIKKLNGFLPAHWSHGNPVDILGDATPDRYRQAVEVCLEDDNVDGVLVMLTPQAMTEPVEAAQAVIDAAKGHDKAVLAAWMGEDQMREAWKVFADADIPAFASPEAAVEAFSYLSNYNRNQQLLVQVPGPLGHRDIPDVEGSRLIIESALREGRKSLSTAESKAILNAFHIPVAPSLDVRSAHEALVAAQTLGFPVAMKINSPDITHKSDVRGVRLNINDAQSVRSVFNDLIQTVKERAPSARIDGVTVEKMYRRPHGRELLVGLTRDPVFGPVVTFGAGGTAVEIHRDKSVALPPLNNFIARELISRTRIARMLVEYRNLPPVDMHAIERVLHHVSELACELPRIRELDINPLVADEEGVIALDVRMGIDSDLPSMDRYGHMAIHPYPAHMVSQVQLGDGTDVTIRPIRPEDAELEQEFVRSLSPQAKYFRFMQALHELTPQMLIRFTQIDYDRELALVAVTEEHGKEVEVAVARYSTKPDRTSCEFALVVADRWQRQGVGTRMMLSLLEAARLKGFRRMDGEILADNQPMLSLVKKLGFRVETSSEDDSIKAVSKPL